MSFFASAAEPAIYPWSENAAVVRVPKTLLTQLAIPSVEGARSGRPRYTLTADFIGAFRVTTNEAERIHRSIEEALRQYWIEIAKHLEPTDEPVPPVVNRPAGLLGGARAGAGAAVAGEAPGGAANTAQQVLQALQEARARESRGAGAASNAPGAATVSGDKFNFKVISFPDETGAIWAKLREDATATLGTERADAFWQNGVNVLETELLDASGKSGTIYYSYSYANGNLGPTISRTRYLVTGNGFRMAGTPGASGYDQSQDPYAPESMKPVLTRWREAIQAYGAPPTVSPLPLRRLADSSKDQVTAIGPGSVPASAPWDNTVPYTELPKNFVTALQVPAWTLAGELSRETVGLLGLTEREEESTRNLYHDFRRRFEEVERQHTERTDRMTEPNKLSLAIHAFPKEAAALQQEFAQKLRTLLGENRGEMLYRSATLPLSGPRYQAMMTANRMARAGGNPLYRGQDWLHRGSDETKLDLTLQMAPDGLTIQGVNIQYQSRGPNGNSSGGSAGGVRGGLESLGPQWRHLVTPEMFVAPPVL